MNKIYQRKSKSDINKNRYALEWAKRNLPAEQYNEIEKSYNSLFIRTLIVVLCCIPIIAFFLYILFEAPFSSKAEANLTPSGATSSKIARVDYDDNFYWTHDSKKYEKSLEDYGLNPENYKFGDKVNVYLDDAQNVIKVTAIEEGLSLRDTEAFIGVIGALVVPIIIIVCIYLPIAFTTFGKPWRQFIRKHYRSH